MPGGISIALLDGLYGLTLLFLCGVSDFRNNTLRSFNRTRQNSFFDAWGKLFGFIKAINKVFRSFNRRTSDSKISRNYVFRFFSGL